MPERRQPAPRPRTISVMTFLAFYFLVLCGGDAGGVGARGVALGASVAGLGRSSAASDSALPSAARNGGGATPLADSLGLDTATWSVTVAGSSRRRRAAAAEDDEEEDAALLEESGRTVTPQPPSPRRAAAFAAATPADPRGTCAAAAAAAAASATSTSGAGSVTSESRTPSPAASVEEGAGLFDGVADAVAVAVRAVLPHASDAVVRAARPHADLPGAVTIPYDAAAAQEAFAAATEAAATDEAEERADSDDVVKVFLGQLRRDATPEFVYFLAGVVAPGAPVLRVEMHTNAAGSNYDAFGRPRGKGCAWLYTTGAGAAQLIAASKTAFLDVDADGSEVLIVAASGNARFAGYCAAFKDQAGRPEHLPRQPFVAELPKGAAAATPKPHHQQQQQQQHAASPAAAAVSVARGAATARRAAPARHYGGYHYQSDADYSHHAQQQYYAYNYDGVSPDAPAFFSFRGAAAGSSHTEWADAARVYAADGARFRWNPYAVTA